MHERTVVAIDYSGTLSRAMVVFGGAGPLRAALVASGLDVWGIDTPRRYWEAVANPIWGEGSVTPTGMATLITRAVVAFRRSHAREVSQAAREAIAGCARAFTTRYFSSATVDEGWVPLLARIAACPSCEAVVATDHFVDATPWCATHLARAGAVAVPIANSAELGACKTSALFWNRLLARVLPSNPLAVSRVVVIDDFGLNEAAEDAYRDESAYEGRRRATERAVAEGMACEAVVSYPFSCPTQDERGWRHGVERAVRWVEERLELPSR